MLKVVILGYGELAQSIVLGVLASRHRLLGVMRWKKNFLKDTFVPDGLLSIMRANNIKDIPVNRANTKQFIKEMKKLNPDVIIVGAWGEIIKEETIGLPKVAFINCHPSLLPKHRGSNPYTSVIRQGETQTGVTFHLVDEKIDSGDILLQEIISVDNDETGGLLRRKCALQAKEMIKPLLDGLEIGEIIPKKQNESGASYYPRLKDKDVMINWNRPAEFICRQIRSLCPEMCCYAQYKNDFLVLKSAEVVSVDKPANSPGVILDKNYNDLLISTADPNKAILLRDVRIYRVFSRIWTDLYIKNKLKVGELLS